MVLCVVILQSQHFLDMDNTLNETDSNRGKEDLKAWVESHPHEYGEMAMGMGEADLLETFIMGQAAFLASPEFQKRLEYMVDTDTVNVDELLEILRQSGFAEKVLTNPGDDEDWEKYRLPFAAWLKNEKMPEMVIENTEDAISLTDNRQAKWQLSKFLKDLMKRLIGHKHRSRKKLGEYLDYRKSLDTGTVAEWALNGIEEHTEETKHTPISINKTEFENNLQSLIASQDEMMVERIGSWVRHHGRGIDIARLFVALVEEDEIKANLTITQFMAALKISFPQCKIVGLRQFQKDIKYLQELLPNGKRYGKDEQENRFAIDKIKTEILQKNPENID